MNTTNKIGYLLTPENALITPVELTITNGQFDLQQLYTLLDCECVTMVELDWGDIWVDEEGLLREKSLSKGFFRPHYFQRLAGNGLVMLRNASTDPIKFIKKQVVFL